MATQPPPPLAPNGLPLGSAWLFPEHEFSRMHPETFGSVIIERILERGSVEQVRWLIQQYKPKVIAAWVRRYGYRRLSHKVFEYWRWVFGIKRYHRPPWERTTTRSTTN